MSFQTGVDLEARCKEANIEVVSRVNFITDPTDAVKTLKVTTLTFTLHIPHSSTLMTSVTYNRVL